MKKLLRNFLGFLGIVTAAEVSAQCNTGEINVTMEITTDAWGYELYWNVTPVGDNCGVNTLASGGNTLVGCGGGGARAASAGDPGAYDNNSTFIVTVGCLTPNDYSLHVVDDWGDGGSRLNTLNDGVAAQSFNFSNGTNATYTFTVQEPPEDNIKVDSTFYEPFTFDYYYRIPIRQAKLLTPGSSIYNVGVNDQTDINLNIQVETTSGIPYEDNVGLPSLLSNRYDTLRGKFLTPHNVGNHTFKYDLTMDAVDGATFDNVFEKTINFTDTVYAMDNNMGTSGIWYGSGETYIIGNAYEIYSQDTATSISVLLGSWTNPAFNDQNKPVSFKLYDFNGADPVEIGSNNFHIITTDEVGTWLTLSLGEIPLTPGFYVAAYESFADTMLILTADEEVPPQTCFVDPGKTGDWYYSTRMVFVRLNTKKSGCESVVITPSSEKVLCTGGTGGEAALTLSGATPSSLSHVWSTGASTSSITGLVSGEYAVTTTYNMGAELCSKNSLHTC
jgi:hypothetical protein